MNIRNIFGYLRDLYDTGAPIYNFEHELNNPKAQNINFFALHDWQALLDNSHVALGTDIVHMHPHVSGAALGESSLIDFRRLCAVVAGMKDPAIDRDLQQLLVPVLRRVCDLEP